MDDKPFDTPEVKALQEAYSVSFTFDDSWQNPIYDSLSAIFRYRGGWAFEDWGMTWRPWSEAWEKLCDAPYAVSYRNRADEFAALREKLLKWKK